MNSDDTLDNVCNKSFEIFFVLNIMQSSIIYGQSLKLFLQFGSTFQVRKFYKTLYKVELQKGIDNLVGQIPKRDNISKAIIYHVIKNCDEDLLSMSLTKTPLVNFAIFRTLKN